MFMTAVCYSVAMLTIGSYYWSYQLRDSTAQGYTLMWCR